MARRSLTRVSCCIALIALICGAGTVLTAEEARDNPPDIPSSVLVNALARQIAFVKSFSVGYPYQYRQDERPRKTRGVVVDDMRTQGNGDR
jgi:hypothetical protein